MNALFKFTYYNKKPRRLVLVGFSICAEMSGLLKKNRLEKPVFLVKQSAWLHASTLQNFARRHFFEVNEIIAL